MRRIPLIPSSLRPACPVSVCGRREVDVVVRISAVRRVGAPSVLHFLFKHSGGGVTRTAAGAASTGSSGSSAYCIVCCPSPTCLYYCYYYSCCCSLLALPRCAARFSLDCLASKQPTNRLREDRHGRFLYYLPI